jgi:ABC-type metal ion transport system substrate-binding protein
MRLLRSLTLAVSAAFIAFSAQAQARAQAQALRIGITPGALADSVEVAARPARAQGLEVKVIDFSDWTRLNTALAASDLLYSGVDDLYFAIRFVTRQDNAKDARVARFVKLYQDAPEVKAQLLKSNNNDSKLFTIPWTAAQLAAAK